MRGRIPQPTSLRVLKGNPGKRPLPEHEPQPPTLGVEPPVGLSDDVRAAWRDLAPVLDATGVLTTADRAAFVALCETWVTWRQAVDMVRKRGLVVKTKTSGLPHVSPYLAIADRALDKLVRLLVEFGMTPSSRSKVTVARAQPSAADKWAGLL